MSSHLPLSLTATTLFFALPTRQHYDASIKPVPPRQLAKHMAFMSQYDEKSPYSTRALLGHIKYCEWDVNLCPARPTRTSCFFDPFMAPGPTLYGYCTGWRVYRYDDAASRAVLGERLEGCFSPAALRAPIDYGKREVEWNDVLDLTYACNATTEAERGVDILHLARDTVINLGKGRDSEEAGKRGVAQEGGSEYKD